MITTDENYKLDEILPQLHVYNTGNVVDKVTCSEKEVLKADGYKVALLDFGAKNNIAQSLHKRGCEVTIYPAHTTAEEILASNPDGIMLSNGPGDPKACTDIIKEVKKLYDSEVWSSAKAVELATRYGADLHVLHLSTARELDLFDRGPLSGKRITNEVCVHHLWFSDADYARMGNFIKWNPAIKSEADRDALRRGIADGRVDVVATDHAPHTLDEKKLPYLKAPSGGPLVQHSLVAMLEMSRNGVFPVETAVEKMCHAPAVRFRIRERGYLREGYFADIVLVRPDDPWTVSPQNIPSKCGWSPFEGVTFSNRVTHTLVNGKIVFRNGAVDRDARGRALEFDR